jgi:hypothetical protein
VKPKLRLISSGLRGVAYPSTDPAPQADLVAAGYPELVGKLDDIRTTIDLEICYLEDRSDLSPSY